MDIIDCLATVYPHENRYNVFNSLADMYFITRYPYAYGFYF